MLSLIKSIMGYSSEELNSAVTLGKGMAIRAFPVEIEPPSIEEQYEDVEDLI